MIEGVKFRLYNINMDFNFKSTKKSYWETAVSHSAAHPARQKLSHQNWLISIQILDDEFVWRFVDLNRFNLNIQQQYLYIFFKSIIYVISLLLIYLYDYCCIAQKTWNGGVILLRKFDYFSESITKCTTWRTHQNWTWVYMHV